MTDLGELITDKTNRVYVSTLIEPEGELITGDEVTQWYEGQQAIAHKSGYEDAIEEICERIGFDKNLIAVEITGRTYFEMIHLVNFIKKLNLT